MLVNTESVHSLVWKSVHNKLVHMEKCPQCQFNTEKVHNIVALRGENVQ